MKGSGVRVEGARFQVSDQVLGIRVYALENWSVKAEPPVSFTASPANVAAEGARFREEVSGFRVSFRVSGFAAAAGQLHRQPSKRRCERWKF